MAYAGQTEIDSHYYDFQALGFYIDLSCGTILHISGETYTELFVKYIFMHYIMCNLKPDCSLHM